MCGGLQNQQLQMAPISSADVYPGRVETQEMRVLAPVGEVEVADAAEIVREGREPAGKCVYLREAAHGEGLVEEGLRDGADVAGDEGERARGAAVRVEACVFEDLRVQLDGECVHRVLLFRRASGNLGGWWCW